MAEENTDQQQQGQQGQQPDDQTDQQADQTQQQQATNPEDTGQQQQTSQTNAAQGKALTGEEVNQIVQKRVNETKEKYADYDDIKAKLAEYEQSEQERKRSEQSELDNAKEDLGTKDEELTNAKQELEQLREKVKRDQINQAFEKRAKEAGIAYVEDAQALADMSKIEVTDEGVTGVDDVIKNLVDSKPFLVKQEEGQRQIGERNNGGQTNKRDESSEEMLKQAAEKARKSGRLEDKIAYVNLKEELKQ